MNVLSFWFVLFWKIRTKFYGLYFIPEMIISIHQRQNIKTSFHHSLRIFPYIKHSFHLKNIKRIFFNQIFNPKNVLFHDSFQVSNSETKQKTMVLSLCRTTTLIILSMERGIKTANEQKEKKCLNVSMGNN